MDVIGALIFGIVVGYITYRTLVRTTEKAATSDLAAVVGAIGGGAVTKLFEPSGKPFAWYAIGLAIGMLVFFVAFWLMNGKAALAKVMVSDTIEARAPHSREPANGPQA